MMSVRTPKLVGLWALGLMTLSSLSLPAFAQSGPAALNVSGGLFLSSGQPVLQNHVNFKIEILDKGATCVLYRELHPGEDLSQTKGGFSLLVGRGSSAQNLIDGGLPAITAKVFENSGSPQSFSGCGTVTLNSGDERMIRIYYDLGAGFVAMSPDVPIVSSAYAMIADSLQGKHAADFLQVNGTASGALNQPNADYAFSLTNWPRLKALLDGTSSQYMTQAPSAPVDFNGQRLTNLASPGTTSDAATKGYADTSVAGKSIDVTGIGPAVGDGKTLVWDQAQNKWVAGTPVAVDSSKLPLSGGTMSGAISMAGYDLYATGNITMSPLKALTLGTYTDADEATLVAGLLPANKGASWYNSTGNVYKIWNGTAAVPQAYLDSVTGKLAASWIPDTSVVAGTYGTSAGKVPTFMVGADGRLTAAGEVTISGVAPGGAAGGDLTGTYPNPSIASNAVTTGKVNDGAINTAKLSATSSALGGRILMTDSIDPNQIAYASCGLSEVMKWTASGWACATVASLSPVTSVAGKTGIVTLNTGDISGLGGAALLDYGTAASELVQLDGTAHILPQLLPVGTGTITGVTAGTALVGGGVSGVVTLNVDVGTTAGKVVQLNGSSQLPGVDGSLLTSVNAVKLQSRDVSSTAPIAGQVLGYNASTSQWEPTNSSVGSVVSVGGGPGLVGGPITSSGSLYVDMGTTAGKVVQLNGSAQLPGVDGSLLMSVNAVKLQTYAVSAVAPAAGQILKWNGSTNVWEAQADLDSGGTVTNIVTSTGLLGGLISGTGTLAVDVGTGANQVVQLDGSALLPILDGSQLFNINASKLATRDVSSAAPIAGQVLGWNSTSNSWQPVSAATGSVVDVTSGTGLVAGSITSAGTINVDVGTGANQVVQLNGSAQLPALDASLLNLVNAVKLQTRDVSSVAPVGGQVLAYNASTSKWEPTDGSVGSVVSVAGGPGLVGGPITTSGSLYVDMGTTAGQVVQLNGSAQLPGVDGSLLTSVNAVKLQSYDVSAVAPAAGQILKWNGSTNVWEAQADVGSGGTVTNIVTSTGLLGGPISAAGTLAVDVGTGANQVVQLDGSSLLPVVDGSQLFNINASKLATRDVASVAPSTGQVLGWNSTSNSWQPVSAATGSVVNVTSGTGLVAGSITSAGTINVDVGTGAGQLVQLDGSSKIPAIDGSLLTLVNAVKLQSYAVSAAAPAAGQILKWNGSTNVWEAQADVGSGGTVTNIVTSTGLLGGPISATGTLAVDVGTGVNQVVQLNGSAQLPALDGSLLTFVNAVKLQTRDVSSAAPIGGQVLAYNASSSKWEPTDGSVGSVVSLSGGPGLIGGPITTSGSLYVDMGTTAGQVVQLNGSAQLPGVDGSLLTSVNAVKLQSYAVSSAAPSAGQILKWNGSTNVWEAQAEVDSGGTVTNIVTSTGLLGGPISSTGTLAVDLGTGANQVVQLNGSALLPAVDGSLLTNINASKLATRDVSSVAPSAGQVLGWNVSSNSWQPVSSATGSVVQVTSGTGLVAGSITSAGTINVDVGTGVNQVVQLNSSAQLPGVDGSLLTSVNAVKLQTYDVSSVAPAAGQILKWNGSTNVWEAKADVGSGGTVTNIVASTGLLGGPISSTGTLAVDVGTGANQIVQLNASSQLAALDASLLTMVNAVKLQTRDVSNVAPVGGQVLAYNASSSQWEPTNGSIGSVVSVAGGRGLVGGPITSSGSLYVDMGTTAGQVVQLNGSAQLPGVDGSLLTSVNAVKLQSYDVSAVAPAAGQILKWNGSTNVWEAQADLGSGGTVTNIVTSTGLLGGPISATGTLAVDVGTGVNQIVQLNASALLPALDGSLLTNINASKLATRDVSSVAPIAGQVLGWNATSSSWQPVSATAGSVVQVTSGVGLVAGSITSAGTINVDVGTGANKIPQLNGSGQLAQSLGSIATPAYSFSGNTNTGFYSPAANEVALSTYGTARLLVDASGNVGIGTTAPTYPLEVNGEISVNGGLNVVDGDSIEIGGTAKLQFYNSFIKPLVPIDASAGAGSLYIYQSIGSNSNPNYSFSGSESSGIYSPATDAVAIATAGNERFRVTTTGNVGIGTTTPRGILELAGTGTGSSTLIVPRDTTAGRPAVISSVNGMMRYNTDLAAFEFFQNGVWSTYTTGTGAGGSVNLVASGTGLLGGPITSGGTLTVDVGTGANKIPQLNGSGQLAQSIGSVSTPAYSFSGNTNTGFYSPAVNQLSFATSGTAAVTIDATGKVGIGTTTPARTLEVNGDIMSSQGLVESYFVSDSLPPELRMTRERTSGPVLSGDVLGHINSGGFNGTAYKNNVAAIKSVVDGSVTTSSFPTRLSFWTTPAGSNTSAERLRIDSSGNVGIGTTSPQSALDIYATGTGASALIVPRDTTAGRPATVSSVNGMLRYNTSTSKFEGFQSGAWTDLVSASSGDFLKDGSVAMTGNLKLNDNWLSNDGGNEGVHVTNAGLVQAGTGGVVPDGTFTNDPAFVVSRAQASAPPYMGFLHENLDTAMIGISASNYFTMASENSMNGLQFRTKGVFGSTQFLDNAPIAMTIDNDGKVGVGTTTPRGILELSATGTGASALIVPRDTTAGRPALVSSVNGMMRYNTNLAAFEFFQNGIWATYNTGSGGGAVSFPLLASPATSTAAAPSYSFTGNANTGFYSPAANQVALSTYGTARLTVDASGNVGIGTTAPSSTLDIQSSSSGANANSVAENLSASFSGNDTNGLTTTRIAKKISTVYSGTINESNGADHILVGQDIDNTFSGMVSSGGNSDNLLQYGSRTTVTATGAIAAGDTAALYGQSQRVNGNLGTTGGGIYNLHVGSAQYVSGTADINAGVYATVSGATKNYGVWIDSPVSSANNYAIYSPATAQSYFAGNVGIGTTIPATGTRLDITGTGAAASSILIPRDTVANRPVTGVNGMLRYASDTNKFEAYQAGAWVDMIGGGGGGLPAANGSAAAPSIAFTNSTGTGLFRAGADILGISTAGTQRMTVLANGNVGIGTTNPGFPLDIFAVPVVNGANRAIADLNDTTSMAVDVGGGIQFGGKYTTGGAYADFAGIKSGKSNGTTGDTGGYMAFNTRTNGSNTAERLRIDSSGNVGIGTATPSAKLEVAGQIVSQESIVASGATADFSNGNSIVLQSIGGTAITVTNMVAGGIYNLVIEDTTPRVYTFTGCATTYFSPANGTTSNRTVFTIYRRGASTCYITWTTGFN